ncbi:MAG: zinc-ribbon domain-containing protein [Ruminococcus sp.]|nr:zinc-ribbon domain-containing protein [Ruminococcus sp.]
MICPSCGAKVDNGYSFCVNCGSRLDAAQEPDYGKADMGGYHSEEEFPEGKGFTMTAGTFVISDRPATGSASDIYTADELNDTDEEFDFSMYDATEESAQPQQQAVPPQPQPYNQYGAPQQFGAPGMQQPVYPGAQYQQPYAQNPQYPGQPVPGAVQPQLIGYDQNGMPVYSQPQMMYGQPQFIGYDQNGMPVYSQPQMMYGQPQFIGYDQNGTPLYSQPQQMMYAQPQFIGYDQNGMPVYSQPVPAGAAMQQYQPPETPAQEAPAQEQQPSAEDDFWAFFDDGKEKEHTQEADFFGRTERTEVEDSYPKNSSSLGVRPPSKKGGAYMSDTPMVDATDLAPNDAHKYNRHYMRNAEMVDASEFQEAGPRKKRDYMAAADEVDADRLAANKHQRSRITMHAAGSADPDQLKAPEPKEKQTFRSDMMREVTRPVEAMPKKKKYVDPTDLIELPEHMKAKKTVKEEKVEIPDLPKVGIE